MYNPILSHFLICRNTLEIILKMIYMAGVEGGSQKVTTGMRFPLVTDGVDTGK